MVDPISLTLASMQNDVQRMNTLSNNSANALTPGFKREFVTATGLFTPLASPGGAASAPLQTVVTDFSPGAPRKTSNPLDVALMGDGYFEVRTDHGTAYTRSGAFHIDQQGRLVTPAGFPVQGTGGEILLSSPNPVINLQGQIFDKDVQVGQLKVVNFERTARLTSIGGGLLLSPNGVAPQELPLARMTQGHLESSNVDSAREMVSMVETFRHFESSNRLLQAYDDMRDKAFRSLGQF